MANFIMHVLVEFVFSDSYMYFALSLNAIIIKLHDEAIYIYIHVCILKRQCMRDTGADECQILLLLYMQCSTCKTKQQYIYLSTTYSNYKLCDLTEKVMYSIKRGRYNQSIYLK